MISPPSTASTAAPRICRVSASTTALMTPRGSAISRARHPARGDLGDADRAALRPRLLFRQADPPELGIDVHGVGDQAAPRGRFPAAQQVVPDDAIVIVRDVCERGTALGVPQGVDA